MPKAVLTFDLPNEREEFDLAIKGVDYMCVLTDYGNWLRSKLKYSELSEQEVTIYEEARTQLYKFANERDIEL